MAVWVAVHPLFPQNQLFSWSPLRPSFRLTSPFLFFPPLLFPIKAAHRGVGSLCFVFEFAFNLPFYYRLALRVLTQTRLPLLKFAEYVICGYFGLNLPKRRIAKIQFSREADKALNMQTGTLSSRVQDRWLEAWTVIQQYPSVYHCKTCYFNQSEILKPSPGHCRNRLYDRGGGNLKSLEMLNSSA